MARATTEKRDDSGDPATITKGELAKLREELRSEKYQRESLEKRIAQVERDAAIDRARHEGFKAGVEAASRDQRDQPYPTMLRMMGPRGPWGY